MKKLVRKLNELLKSKDTLLCESIIAKAKKDEITFRTDGYYRPFGYEFKHRDVELISQDMTLSIVTYDLSHAVIIDCNVSIHKYLPLINSDKKPIDVHVDFHSNRVSLIDKEANEYSVKTSAKMRRLIEKAIKQTITIN